LVPPLLTFNFIPAEAQTVTPSCTARSAEVERRVDAILRGMALEEKIDLIGGVDGFFIRGLARLGLPRMTMADGPFGVRNFGPATAMAGGIALAATWNPTLAKRVGTELGRDARAKGVHFLLAPGVNIYRAPMNGRNFEYFGEDPFLASRMAVGYIKGVQAQGVAATIKHFIGNNSEFDRHNTDSVIDERTMREIYLPVFEAAVKEARVGAVMDSYNLTNGIHMSQHSYLNTDVLKKEWGFDGIVMSDWGGTYDGVAASNGGLDLEMPSGRFMNRKDLLPAVERGEVSVATIDEKVRRIVRTAIRFCWIDRDQTDLAIPRYNQQGRRVALEAAREGMVLLKNEASLLPLNKGKIKSIAVIGPNAHPAVPVGGGSAGVQPFAPVSFLEGLSNNAGTAANVYYHRGLPTLSELANATKFSTAEQNGQPGLRTEIFDNMDLSGIPTTTRIDQHINLTGNFDPLDPSGTPGAYSIRWSGYYVPDTFGTYDIFVQEEGAGFRLYLDDKLLFENWGEKKVLLNQVSVRLSAGPHKIVLEYSRRRGAARNNLRMGIAWQGSLIDPAAKALATKANVVVIAVGFNSEIEGEGGDRMFPLPVGQDELIRQIAAVNEKTVVVITSGGGVDMSAWLDRVPAIVQAWYLGQEGGTALAEVLFGAVNPSGRLPVTFERRWADNPVYDSYYNEPGTKRIVYKEGVFVGYRGYEHNRVKPLYPFGYGLSYTIFKFSNLTIKPATGGEASGDSSRPLYEISFDVSNAGVRVGAAVAQLYIADKHASVPRPPKELKGFAKVSLKPGQTQRVTLRLDVRSLAYYDVNGKQWRAEAGTFEVLVGTSSEQIELTGKLKLTSAVSLK